MFKKKFIFHNKNSFPCSAPAVFPHGGGKFFSLQLFRSPGILFRLFLVGEYWKILLRLFQGFSGVSLLFGALYRRFRAHASWVLGRVLHQNFWFLYGYTVDSIFRVSLWQPQQNLRSKSFAPVYSNVFLRLRLLGIFGEGSELGNNGHVGVPMALQ